MDGLKGMDSQNVLLSMHTGEQGYWVQMHAVQLVTSYKLQFMSYN